MSKDTSCYASMVERIRKAEDIDKISASLDRLYNAGIFSVKEFQRLDGLIMRRNYQLRHLKGTTT